MDSSPANDALIGTIRALRRHLRLIAACMVTAALVALVFSLTQEKQYSASASLLFRDPQFDQKLFGDTFNAPNVDPTREAATNAGLVSLEVIAARTSRKLGGSPSPDEISSKMDVSQQGQADLVAVTAKDPKPRFAARLANTFADEYIAFRRDADRSTIRDAQVLLQRQLDNLPPDQRRGRDGTALAARVAQLQILGPLQTGNAELVQPARVPSSPSSPRTARNIALGLVVGLLIGLALAVAHERLDRRLREPSEVEDIFGRPIVAQIPESKALSRGQLSPGPEVTEAFGILRANLRYFQIADRELRSILVASATPGDGKTTVALHLAAASARVGNRTLLLEADLRAPSLASMLGLGSSAGLSDALLSRVDLSDAIVEVPASLADSDDTGPYLAVLPAGSTPPNPTDLIESQAMRDLLLQAESQFDFVVVDTPPLLVVPDAIPIVRAVSGVTVVARMGTTTRPAARQLKDRLDNLAAPVLGVVVNSAPQADNFAYGYGYDQESSPEARSRT